MFKRFSIILVVFLLAIMVSGCDTKKTSITKEEAQRIAENIILDEQKAQITNIDSPEIAKSEENSGHMVALKDNKNRLTLNNILDRTVWKVTYHTEMDELLGPIVIYIDFNSGKVYGLDLRE